MLNDIWNGLVNEVETVKRHYNELETTLMTANECLNNGLSAVIKSVDALETKGRSLHNMYNNMQVMVNAQEHKICDLDNKINFYSQSLIKLEGEKAEKVKDRLDALEQRITGQDDQIKVLLHRLASVEGGHCHCRESIHEVISCHCFSMITKLTEDV